MILSASEREEEGLVGRLKREASSRHNLKPFESQTPRNSEASVAGRCTQHLLRACVCVRVCASLLHGDKTVVERGLRWGGGVIVPRPTPPFLVSSSSATTCAVYPSTFDTCPRFGVGLCSSERLTLQLIVWVFTVPSSVSRVTDSGE